MKILLLNCTLKQIIFSLNCTLKQITFSIASNLCYLCSRSITLIENVGIYNHHEIIVDNVNETDTSFFFSQINIRLVSIIVKFAII